MLSVVLYFPLHGSDSRAAHQRVDSWYERVGSLTPGGTTTVARALAAYLLDGRADFVRLGGCSPLCSTSNPSGQVLRQASDDVSAMGEGESRGGDAGRRVASPERKVKAHRADTSTRRSSRCSTRRGSSTAR